MFLISTRNFPPDIGGIQNLMEGLSNALLNHGPVKVFADNFENAETYDDNSKLDIQRIFIQLIFTIGFFGIVLGNIIGYLMASNITEMLNFLSEAFNIAILSVYYLDYFPSIFSFDQVLIINIITLFLLILFGMLPARKAAKMNPVEIINNP